MVVGRGAVEAAADFAEAKFVFFVPEHALGRDVVLPAIPRSGGVRMDTVDD
jgi:hypothetical protein